MARTRVYDELNQKLSKCLDDAREVMMQGKMDLALEGLNQAQRSMDTMREFNGRIDQALQEKFDAFARDMVIAQEIVNEHNGGVSAAEEVHDGGGGAAAPEQQADVLEPQTQPAVQELRAVAAEPQGNYGACGHNATDQQGYVALAGDEEGGAEKGTCPNCVIL